MIRGYDTNALRRHDEIQRIRHVEAEIAAMQEEIDRQKLKTADREVRIKRLKKEMGIID